MQVIGAGLGRTGTGSLKAALERLGFAPCHHMFEVLADADRARSWTEVAEGRGPDWDAVLGGYRACVDLPVAVYWRELARRYPDAKIILSVRDPERWYASARSTIFRLPRLLRHPLLGPPLRLALPVAARLATPPPVARAAARPVRWPLVRRVAQPVVRLVAFTRMLEALNRDRRDIAFDRASALAYFERHNAAVVAEIPADRLLVYQVSEGWPPLCAFLGVPVPDEPFPRANDRGRFWRAFWRTVRTGRPPADLSR
nr:sulfotransferase family protein [Actinomadura hibisca]